MKVITVHELKKMIDGNENILIIDTRDHDDFEEGHIPGSVNIPRLEFADHIAEIPKDIPVVILCKYGKKSEQLSLNLMVDHGYRNTCSLQGGLFDWSREIDDKIIIW